MSLPFKKQSGVWSHSPNKINHVFKLPQMIPAILHMIDVSSPTSRAVKFKELGSIMGVMGTAAATYYPQIFSKIFEFWLQPSQVS